MNFAFTDFSTGVKFETDYMGKRWCDSEAMLACLHRAINAGIPFFSGEYLSKVTRKDLEAVGIRFACFNPWFRRGLARLHRKIVVIDRRLAFLGGLNINDDFIISHLGVFLYGTYITGKEPGVELGKQLFTYVPYELGIGNTINDTPVRLKNLYTGALKIAVNNIVYLEKWDTRKSEKITRTQFSPYISGVANATTPSNDFSFDGMVKFEPLITLSGAKKNDISILLPQAIEGGAFTTTLDDGNKILVNITRIAVRMYGLLAQNASSFQG
jgi:hypothetical protein